ncbi:MAG TPA: hypothetical protein VHN18_11245 [Micromonosporaceae bacterium]|nr:hypothetical protein [Micromonosporaceae bacterium]
MSYREPRLTRLPTFTTPLTCAARHAVKYDTSTADEAAAMTSMVGVVDGGVTAGRASSE